MKKNYSLKKSCCFAFALFCFSSAYSQTRVIEDFNTYKAGSEPIDLKGLGTATNGWGGPWEQTHGQILITPGNLIGGDAAGQHARSVNSTTSVNYYRYFKDVYENKAGATYWLSFQYDPVVVPNWGGLGLYHYGTEILLIGTPNGYNELGMGGPGLISQVMEGTSASDKARFVARIDMKGEAGGTPVIYIWKDPVATAQPAIENADIMLEVPRLAKGFNRVRLGHRNDASLAYDHIRVSSNWEEVFQLDEPEPGPEQEPVYLAKDNFDSYELAAGETDLKGLGTATNGWGGPWEQADGRLALKAGNHPADADEAGKSAVTESVEGSPVNYYRLLSGTWKNTAGTTYWLGFHFNPVTAPNWGGLFLYQNHAELMALGTPNNTGKLGLVKSGTNPVIEETTAMDPTWFVARIDMSGPEGTPRVHVWNNPDPTTEPTIETAAISADVPALANGFNRVRIGNHASGSIAYDHISLSKSWSDIPFQHGVVTGIDAGNFLKNDLQVYPVPATGTLYIDNAENTTLTLTSMDGRKLKTLEISSGKAAMDVSDLKAGFYIISFDKGSSQVFRRIIIGN